MFQLRCSCAMNAKSTWQRSSPSRGSAHSCSRPHHATRVWQAGEGTFVDHAVTWTRRGETALRLSVLSSWTQSQCYSFVNAWNLVVCNCICTSQGLTPCGGHPWVCRLVCGGWRETSIMGSRALLLLLLFLVRVIVLHEQLLQVRDLVARLQHAITQIPELRAEVLLALHDLVGVVCDRAESFLEDIHVLHLDLALLVRLAALAGLRLDGLVEREEAGVVDFHHLRHVGLGPGEVRPWGLSEVEEEAGISPHVVVLVDVRLEVHPLTLQLRLAHGTDETRRAHGLVDVFLLLFELGEVVNDDA
mmetsp:Transcript_46997/g.108625  ORF Transcript_46997/g.108625 Transcript_46997/m.108625 type:complete len:303 (+) Transcript_46997:151-1059(+)